MDRACPGQAHAPPPAVRTSVRPTDRDQIPDLRTGAGPNSAGRPRGSPVPAWHASRRAGLDDPLKFPATRAHPARAGFPHAPAGLVRESQSQTEARVKRSAPSVRRGNPPAEPAAQAVPHVPAPKSGFLRFPPALPPQRAAG